MTETIVSAILGFFTIPFVFVGIAAVGRAGSFVTRLELSAAGYWSGFGLFVGLSLLVGAGIGLWSALSR